MIDLQVLTVAYRLTLEISKCNKCQCNSQNIRSIKSTSVPMARGNTFLWKFLFTQSEMRISLYFIESILQ